MSYKLFLDDVREPKDCVGYMYQRIGKDNPMYLDTDWVIVRDYFEFFMKISDMGLPSIVSFGHDLAMEHYSGIVGEQSHYETGEDCAKWLVGYCKWKELPLPTCWIHSMNPVGSENIKKALNDFYHIRIAKEN